LSNTTAPAAVEKNPDFVGWADGIAANIVRLIEERGTSKPAVIQASGIARSSFHRKLNHHPELFTVAELGSIAEVLGVTLTDLVRVP
jgi:hypothetical protein